MRVLVFGIGVIGAYLTHVLCEAGNEVTVRQWSGQRRWEAACSFLRRLACEA